MSTKQVVDWVDVRCPQCGKLLCRIANGYPALLELFCKRCNRHVIYKSAGITGLTPVEPVSGGVDKNPVG